MATDAAEVSEASVLAPEGANIQATANSRADRATRSRRRVTWKRALLGTLAMVVLAGVLAFPQRHKFSAQGADLSRRVIGDENTARVEAWYFRVDDRIAKTKYRLLGGSTDPFGAIEPRMELVRQPKAREVIYVAGSTTRSAGSALSADSLGPPVMVLPKTVPLRENLEAGEGVWTFRRRSIQ